MKLIKPDHGPDLPPLVLAVSPVKMPVKKVKRAKPVPRSNSDKHEIFILKRVIALQDLLNQPNRCGCIRFVFLLIPEHLKVGRHRAFLTVKALHRLG